MDTLLRIKQEVEAFQKKKTQLIEELRKDFIPIFQPLFDKHKSVEKVSWQQFTVYFNDGDECYFSVYHDADNLTINDIDGYNWEDDEEQEDTKDIDGAFDDFSNALQEIPDEFFKDLFGDHKEVTINRDGTITVDNYTDHD